MITAVSICWRQPALRPRQPASNLAKAIVVLTLPEFASMSMLAGTVAAGRRPPSPRSLRTGARSPVQHAQNVRARDANTSGPVGGVCLAILERGCANSAFYVSYQ